MKNTNAPSGNPHDGGLLYITSDQQVFFEIAHATRHARTLEDLLIVTMTQQEADAQLMNISNRSQQDELEELLDSISEDS